MAYQYLKGDYKQNLTFFFFFFLNTPVDSDRKRGSGFKLKKGIFRADVRRCFSTERVSEALEQVVQRSWMTHPWRHSRPSWMGPWATSPSA